MNSHPGGGGDERPDPESRRHGRGEHDPWSHWERHWWHHHGRHAHHGHHHRFPPWRNPEWRRTWSMQRYLRARMHRRLFAWFFVAIFVAGAATIATFGVAMHRQAPAWNQQVDWVRGFAGEQFASKWDRPAERDAFAHQLAEHLSLGVEVVDANDQTLYAERPCHRPQFTVPVQRGGTTLGTVLLCTERRHTVGITTFLPLGFAFVFLWAASGQIARRLTRPIADLARVAHDLGAGRLSSRPNLQCFDHGEVRVLAEAMNDMAERIEKQLKDQRELLAAVSHELRTPLGHIRLLVELARSGAQDPKPLEELDAEVVEMDALVGQLLASARLDFASLTFTQLDAVELATRALERAGLPTSLLQVEAPVTAFTADATLVSRALSNLVENARKHGRGVTRLKVGGRPGTVCFEVEDSGPGFAPGEEARAFEPFYRKPKGTEREVSLGLGLHLVKRTAEAHGGRVFASNLPAGGACVGFELPLASAASSSAPAA